MSTTRPSSKRTLRFACETQIFTVRSSGDITDDEVFATWYSTDEYVAMKRATRRTVRRMHRGEMAGDGSDDDYRHCVRGLEHLRSTTHLEQHRINKDTVIESVLAEQERQWRAGVCQSAELARASSMASQWARELATRKGSDDAAFVRSLGEGERWRSRAAVLEQALEIAPLPPPSATKQGRADLTKEFSTNSFEGLLNFPLVKSSHCLVSRLRPMKGLEKSTAAQFPQQNRSNVNVVMH